MRSSKDVGGVGAISADWRAAASRKAARSRATALGELAIEKAMLSKQVAALEESNSRLEELAGSVTHDLSEGLATIAMFVDALERRLGDGTGPAARELDGIRAGLERMSLLIAEELESARVGSRGVPVDSEAALAAALSNIEARRAGVEAEIVFEGLPWVICDQAGLARLFQNLLANSLAAKSPRRDLRIEISAHRVGLSWRFDVEDTGIGIAPDLAGELPRSAASGADARHGRGLAICRRIVEAHGGTIHATCRPDGGTTVSFDLLAGNPPSPARPTRRLAALPARGPSGERSGEAFSRTRR